MSAILPHICPWWLTYTFDNPLRRLIHNPRKMLSGLVRPGMTAADLGCGMGYFTAALAELDRLAIDLSFHPQPVLVRQCVAHAADRRNRGNHYR